jgi:hypothetical protein
MTPSLTLKPAQLKDQAISPLSPLPSPSETRRPFSFEPAPASPLQVPEQPKSAVPIITPPSMTAPPAQSESPIWPSSADLYDLYDATPPVSPVTAPSPAPASQEPETRAAVPVQEVNVQPSPVTQTHPSVAQQPSTPLPFTPLTRVPISLPKTLIPAITRVQLSCYTNHRNIIWSNNTFQPMGCMICHQNDRERKWCCIWCKLRICTGCSQELCMIPGRKLATYLDERAKLQDDRASQQGVRVPNNILSAVFERDEDFS